MICAYITDDEEGCGALRDTAELTYQQWHESATVLCATVLDLIAFDIDSHPLAVIDRYDPRRHEIFPGPRHLPEATTAIVYYDLHQQAPEPDAVGANIVPSLFDIAVSGIEQLAQLWGRPPVEVARLLTVAAATYERDAW
ncbi:hypothetical protein [Rhodococcus qingshengii]|uniref:hypothetical protein n=1 Tax=Rhodococcus TaxID=1827 RepID=UPI001BA59DE7|nr:hypothetical protein [Rhodococcus qingshengii]MBS3693875.1 hypothetical protein [Rhodococcus qingshengii]